AIPPVPESVVDVSPPSVVVTSENPPVVQPPVPESVVDVSPPSVVVSSEDPPVVQPPVSESVVGVSPPSVVVSSENPPVEIHPVPEPVVDVSLTIDPKFVDTAVEDSPPDVLEISVVAPPVVLSSVTDAEVVSPCSVV
ncbi:hypothetical protein PENTCL1PPCAC_25900, partial [Pristionchus entomophagus]